MTYQTSKATMTDLNKRTNDVEGRIEVCGMVRQKDAQWITCNNATMG